MRVRTLVSALLHHSADPGTPVCEVLITARIARPPFTHDLLAQRPHSVEWAQPA